MHKYMRAIGFSEKIGRDKMREIITDCIMNPTTRMYTTNKDDVMLGEFCKDFAENIGISVCGEFDDDSHFVYEYYYPYLKGMGISSTEDISVERHASKESYAGVCDDAKLGITMIFYLQNMMDYVKIQAEERLPMKGTSLTLSGLSISGSIMLPILMDENQKKKSRKDSKNRSSLIAKARQGDEDALETLTLEDMDIYTSISKRIQNEDVYSLVDSYFMPYGVECDQYSVLGEITACKSVVNKLTGETVHVMTVVCNDVSFDLCINAKDLFGEPGVGRRFKGIVWMQGMINFPEL
ncbi:MAG: DUF3881 family protein [Lachnospiraceae bacterium]|nr:DUF3881 family protein [Lachnospiraceae bacterium]